MSTDEERICSIALTQIPGVGHIGAKRLVDGMGSAADVFRYRTELPDRLPGVNQAVVAALDSPQALKRAEREYEFVRDNRISCLTMADEGYPSRLRECDDAPVVLFFKGKADLNAFHIINVVGTRNATDYGKQICVSFLQDLRRYVRMYLLSADWLMGSISMPTGQHWLSNFLLWEYWLMGWTVFTLRYIVKQPLICSGRVDC